MVFDPKSYRLFDIVGRGSFGQVHRAIDPNGKVIAVKIIDTDGSDLEETLSEIQFLRTFKHPNVLQLFNAELVGSDVWLCTEYCAGGSLHRVIKMCGAVSEPTACYVLRSLLSAVEYIHDHNIIHRDLKPANIFLDGYGQVKLGDFGVSAQLTATHPGRYTMIGTPFWMAPEVISENCYGAPADIWGVGVIAFEMVTGSTPWSGYKPTQAMVRIADDEAPALTRNQGATPGLLSVHYVSLVHRCLQKDPTKRPTARELVHQKWLCKYESPTREFRQLVRVQVSRQPPLGRISKPTDSGNNHAEDDGWDFSTSSPPEPALSSPTRAMGAKRHENTREYLDYFDCAFRAVENRSLKAECKIQIGRVRMMLKQLDAEVYGLGQTLLDEAMVAEQTNIRHELWIDHVFYRVESRSVRDDAKRHLRLARMSLIQLERAFPGFGRAFVQEVYGRIRHSPRFQEPNENYAN